MALKAKHAFGNSVNLDGALNSGAIDAYDILFLDGDTNPKIGWIDKNGVVRLVESKAQVIRVDELPTASGDAGVVYIYNNEGYIWNGEQCVPMSKSADLTALETQVSNLESQIDNKIDADVARSMIEEAVENATSEEVIEF